MHHIFVFSRHSQFNLLFGGEDFFPEDKVDRTGEADHSPPSGAEIKNACDYTSTRQYALMTRYLITQWKNLAL